MHLEGGILLVDQYIQIGLLILKFSNKNEFPNLSRIFQIIRSCLSSICSLTILPSWLNFLKLGKFCPYPPGLKGVDSSSIELFVRLVKTAFNAIVE